ncbi:MAG: histidine kinase [Lachnospiraceae bacterium]|nr:histidine kinase [Lachnospiraceae bacterium]
MELFSLALSLSGVFVIAIMIVGVSLSKMTYKRKKKLLLWMSFHCGTVFMDMMVSVSGEFDGYLYVVIGKIAEFLLFCGAVYYAHLYLEDIFRKMMRRVTAYRRGVIVYLALLNIINISSVITGFTFRIENASTVKNGPFWYVVYFFAAMVYFADICIIMYNKVKNRESLSQTYVLGAFFVLSLLVQPICYLYEAVFPTYFAISLCFIIYYIYYNVNQYKWFMENEVEREKRKTKLMLSQIQPHFIFNSLTTIKYLVMDDPVVAEMAVTKFTSYLRANLESLSVDRTIVNFDKELEHTEIYLWLEQLRFEDFLKVEYYVETRDFKIPMLTLQPIVENAVKHGICKKKDGGTVTIRVKEKSDAYEIEIKDDGVGFDVENVINDPQYDNGGIANVSKRLTGFNYSTMSILSKKDCGTTVKISLTKE